MSESRHTPGPWEIGGASHIYAAGPDGANICSMSEPRASKIVGYTPVLIGSKCWSEIYANAKLIAAAPDLLEALIEVRRRLKTPPTKDGDDVWAQINAAIAKATGQS